MKKLAEIHGAKTARKERIMQFGEGNFLRAFVDWMVHKMNAAGVYDGSVVLVQPIARGLTDLINENNGLYTVILRGVENGKVVEDATIVESVSRCVDPYRDFKDFMAIGENPDLRFIVSNTTEAGIAYAAGDKPTDAPPASYPAKLAVFLHHRWLTFKGAADKGLVMVPCELIDRNGDKLKETVYRWAEEWKYESAFIDWLKSSCDFLNSLVDRIVTGYPKEEAEAIWNKLGYRDDLLDTAEPFLVWVIEGNKKYGDELPFRKAGFDVIWTDDMTPYRTRKVRILNGAHTSSVLGAYLAGVDTVREMVEDPVFAAYVRNILNEEIMPILTLPKKDVQQFAAAVLERFANPFIKHRLLDISLNSVSKFKARVLPSLQEAAAAKGKATSLLAFSLSALVAFYRGTKIVDGALQGDRNGVSYPIRDDLPVLETFAKLWTTYDNTDAGAKKLMDAVLANEAWWGDDLRKIPGLSDTCGAALVDILKNGAKAAVARAAGADAAET
ncbi:MAG: tagaturonate reductase [Treponemataceae bacterium]